MQVLDKADLTAVLAVVNDPQYNKIRMCISTDALNPEPHQNFGASRKMGTEDAKLGRHPERSARERPHD